MSGSASVCEVVMAERIPDELERRIILATQTGLPLDPQPYHRIAESLGVSADEVMARMSAMLQVGVIRRIAAVPDHYRLGFRANGMTVWDVPDEKVQQYGNAIGALDFVSHCYHRPRHLPEWRYNLFAMVHGRDRDDVKEHITAISQLLGEDNRASDVLYSTRILKKTGLRIRSGQD